MDSDVELVKSIDDLLEYDAWFAIESGGMVNTGLGFGSIKENPLLYELMDDYRNLEFELPDGQLNMIACPQINSKVFIRRGLTEVDEVQLLDDGKLIVFATDYFNPKRWSTGEVNIKEQTYSIHHWQASWISKDDLRRMRGFRKRVKWHIQSKWHVIKCFPQKCLRKILGDKSVERIKDFIGKR